MANPAIPGHGLAARPSNRADSSGTHKKLGQPLLLLFALSFLCLALVQFSIKGKVDPPFLGLKFGVLLVNLALIVERRSRYALYLCAPAAWWCLRS